jgi:predicted peroxiredoxin
MRMQGLTIIVASADPSRFHAALSLAAANCALGNRSRIFLQGEAAGLFKGATWAQVLPKGVPSLSELREEAMAVGVEMIVCQSGLAQVDLSAEALPQGVTTGGLVELLASRGDDQLMLV